MAVEDLGLKRVASVYKGSCLSRALLGAPRLFRGRVSRRGFERQEFRPPRSRSDTRIAGKGWNSVINTRPMWGISIYDEVGFRIYNPKPLTLNP